MKRPKVFEVILGTYEEFVVGYRITVKKKSDVEHTQSFASHSHNGSIRCVTHSDHYLASGGADDRIVVYDLKSRKEHCMLTHHNGTVNCLQFTEGHTHLISGGSDGMLAITRVGNWQLEKIFDKAHKGASIIDVAVHPTSKLALTLGADATLRTWNLIKGRQAYVINLNSKSKDPRSLQYIKWAPDGVRFLLCGGLHTDVWSIDTGGILNAIEHRSKVSYALFYKQDILAVGFENGTLTLIDLDNTKLQEVQAHSSRLKSIDICKGYLVTCSSDGEVKVWNKYLEEICKCNTGCRNTCLTVVLPTWIKKEENDEDVVGASILQNKIEVITVEDEEKTVKRKKKKKALEESVVTHESPTPKKKSKSVDLGKEFVGATNEASSKTNIKNNNQLESCCSEDDEKIAHKKKKKKQKGEGINFSCCVINK